MKKFSQLFQAKLKPIQTLEYKWKGIICSPDTPFQVYVSFGPETEEGKFYLENVGLKNTILM